MQENEVTQADREAASNYCMFERHSEEALAMLLATVRQQAEDAMRKRAAQVCDDQIQVYLQPSYAGTNLLASSGERFACGQCAAAIRAATLSKEGECE